MLSSCFAAQNIYVMTVNESRKHVPTVMRLKSEILGRGRLCKYVLLRNTCRDGFCFRYESKQKRFNHPNFFIRCGFIALCYCHEEMTSFQDFTFLIAKTEANPFLFCVVITLFRENYACKQRCSSVGLYDATLHEE